jgi:hypothetical protein
MTASRRTPEDVRAHLLAPVIGQLPLFAQNLPSLYVRTRGRRIQRLRGERLPGNTVFVGRPTRFGNPYRCSSAVRERERAVQQYRQYLFNHPELIEAARADLAGHDLACWCPLDDGPCHADVLLDLAATAGAGAAAQILLAG